MAKIRAYPFGRETYIRDPAQNRNKPAVHLGCNLCLGKFYKLAPVLFSNLARSPGNRENRKKNIENGFLV
jgi:hypothetical protein